MKAKLKISIAALARPPWNIAAKLVKARPQ